MDQWPTKHLHMPSVGVLHSPVIHGILQKLICIFWRRKKNLTRKLCKTKMRKLCEPVIVFIWLDFKNLVTLIIAIVHLGSNLMFIMRFWVPDWASKTRPFIKFGCPTLRLGALGTWTPVNVEPRFWRGGNSAAFGGWRYYKSYSFIIFIM